MIRHTKIIGTSDQIEALVIALEIEGVWGKLHGAAVGHFPKRGTAMIELRWFYRTTAYSVEEMWVRACELARKMKLVVA